MNSLLDLQKQAHKAFPSLSGDDFDTSKKGRCYCLKVCPHKDAVRAKVVLHSSRFSQMRVEFTFLAFILALCIALQRVHVRA